MNSAEETHILIADDHRIFRDGLRKLLEAEPGFKVIGEASDGEAAIRLALELKPDVLLLDVAMPRQDGVEALRELAALRVPVRTILLTAEIDRAHIVEALQLGACGVVLKESASEMLFESIRAVAAGQYWLGRESVSELVVALRDLSSPSGSKPGPSDFGLTPRELEIVGTIVGGLTNRDIAQKFEISEHTVKHHVTNIFDKLGVSNRLELALFAVNHHLVE